MPIGRSNIILTDVNTNHWKIPVTPTYDCSNTAMTFRKNHNFNVQTYNAQLVGAATVIEQHLTKTPCPATMDTNLYMGLCIPQENPSHLISQYPPYTLVRPLKRNPSPQGNSTIRQWLGHQACGSH